MISDLDTTVSTTTSGHSTMRASEFGDRLTILAGAEIDFHTDTYDAVEAWVSANLDRYDFTIGSVHYASDGRLIYPAAL